MELRFDSGLALGETDGEDLHGEAAGGFYGGGGFINRGRFGGGQGRFGGRVGGYGGAGGFGGFGVGGGGYGGGKGGYEGGLGGYGGSGGGGIGGYGGGGIGGYGGEFEGYGGSGGEGIGGYGGGGIGGYGGGGGMYDIGNEGQSYGLGDLDRQSQLIILRFFFKLKLNWRICLICRFMFCKPTNNGMLQSFWFLIN